MSDRTDEPPQDGRREDERRAGQLPFTGSERRRGERRTGKDRRSAPRS